MSNIRYRPEIDGLRAIAIVPVVFFHLDKGLLPGGFIGVDVFFVISGFLITSIVVSEHNQGVFLFSRFWLRRSKRILPALIAMVLTTLCLGFFFLYAPDIHDLGSQGIASLLSFANISHLLAAGNYWGQAAEASPFLHTWSLSLEEQFYLFFPLTMVLTLSYFPHRAFLIITALVCSSFFIFFVGALTKPSATFYLLPTRAWELGVGALVAILILGNKVFQGQNPWLAGGGLFAVLLSYYFVSGENGISPLLAFPVIGTAFVIAFTCGGRNIIATTLSLRPIVYIGKTSYSLYLWHWPILVLSKQLCLKHEVEFSSLLPMIVIIAISFLSYHFIEVPARRSGRSVPYILACLFAALAVSYLFKSLEFSEDVSIYNTVKWDGQLYNVNPVREWPESVKRRMKGIIVTREDSGGGDYYSSGGIKKSYGDSAPDIVVLGDSHALMWAKTLDEASKGLGRSIAFYCADGTSAFFKIPPIKEEKGTLFFSASEKYEFDSARLKYLEAWRPKIIVIAARWSNVTVEETADLIEYIGKIGSRVLLIEQPPELFFGDKNAPQYLSYMGIKPSSAKRLYIEGLNSENYTRGRAVVREIAKKCDYCQVLPIADIFLNGHRVWVVDFRDVLYIDDDHLSFAGALKAKDRIEGALEALLLRRQVDEGWSHVTID